MNIRNVLLARALAPDSEMVFGAEQGDGAMMPRG